MDTQGFILMILVENRIGKCICVQVGRLRVADCNELLVVYQNLCRTKGWHSHWCILANPLSSDLFALLTKAMSNYLS